MFLGIADHLGWAVAVTADHQGYVIDRRRIELVEPGVTAAPVHYDRGQLDDDDLARLVADARGSIVRSSNLALDDLVSQSDGQITTICLRAIPDDFPTDLGTQRRAPYEAKVDAIRYRQILAELAIERGWSVHYYVTKEVIGKAANLLGDEAEQVLQSPRRRLGAPWGKDHRVALAATIVAAAES